MRGTAWIDGEVDGEVKHIRVCVICGHGPGYHFKPGKPFEWNGEVIQSPGGCKEDGCSCPFSSTDLRAFDEVVDETEEQIRIEQEKGGSDYWCEACEAGFNTYDVEPMYECSECGAEFTRSNSMNGFSHQCPDCGRFGRKVDTIGCPNCGEAVEG